MSEEAGRYQIGGSHYLRMTTSPWDVIDGWPPEQKLGYYRGNALKYLLRMGMKNAAIDDARKAEHYVTKLVQTLRQTAETPTDTQNGKSLRERFI